MDDVDKFIIDQIEKLEHDMFGRGGLNEWHIPFIIRYGKVYVVELGSRVIGVAELMRSWDTPDDIYLIGLSIDKRYQGKMLGRKLLETIIDDLNMEEIDNIFLTLDQDNKAALKLYSRVGFIVIDELSDEYGAGADRLLMKKELKI